MNQIVKTENHPNKKRKILGPIGRFVLKLVNWDIVGDLPDKKRIIIASAPHSSTFDAIYAYIVCLATDLKFYFLGSVSMFTRIVVPLPFKKNPDKLGIPHPFGKIQNKVLLNFGGIPVWRAKSTGVTQQVIEQLKSKDKFILYLTVEGEMKAPPIGPIRTEIASALSNKADTFVTSFFFTTSPRKALQVVQ